MEVIVVVAVGVGAEHGLENPAGFGMHFAQKRLSPTPAPPMLRHVDFTSVAQSEHPDIKRVGIGVLADTARLAVVAAAAGIGRHVFDADDVTAQMSPCCRRHNRISPFGKG